MTEKPLADIYDEFAKTYEQNRSQFDMSSILDNFYTGMENKTGKMLDLGCGAGEPFARYFVDRGWDVIGVDFSQRMLDLASKYVPEMQAVYSDINGVDFKSQQFDVVTAIYSLFHVPSKHHGEMFRKFGRWLKADGRAMFTYATVAYTGCEEYDGYKEFLGKDLYYSHLTTDDLYAALDNSGLVVESAQHREIGGETFLWVTVSKQQ